MPQEALGITNDKRKEQYLNESVYLRQSNPGSEYFLDVAGENAATASKDSTNDIVVPGTPKHKSGGTDFTKRSSMFCLITLETGNCGYLLVAHIEPELYRKHTRSDYVLSMHSSEDAAVVNKAGKDPSSLVEFGDFLNDRWQIRNKIGNGSFGQIFAAKNMRTKEWVAVKVESTQIKFKFIHMEHAVLKHLQNRPHIAKYYGSGRIRHCNYIVMEMLGRNIQDLKEGTGNNRFTLPTALRLAYAMLRAIQVVHQAGFLHRDIKPANFMLGLPEKGKDRSLYILDFGLCRSYRTKNGHVRNPRKKCGFIGSIRYASPNVHCYREMGRHDDIWSLFYVLYDMVNGTLPWRDELDRDQTRDLKLSIPSEKFLRIFPPEIATFYRLLEDLTYYDTPPYDHMAQCFEVAIANLNVQIYTPFDWEAAAASYNGGLTGTEAKQMAGASCSITVTERVSQNMTLSTGTEVQPVSQAITPKQLVSSEYMQLQPY